MQGGEVPTESEGGVMDPETIERELVEFNERMKYITEVADAYVGRLGVLTYYERSMVRTPTWTA